MHHIVFLKAVLTITMYPDIQVQYMLYFYEFLACSLVNLYYRQPSVCPHSLNIFSSKTTRPIQAKFHMEPVWGCSNGPGHMTKMAAMPIYRKNL